MKSCSRFFLLAFLVSFIGFVLTGCARDPANCQDENDNALLVGSSTGEVFEQGGVLIRTLGAEPANLNPITATDVYENIINAGVYEALIERDNETLGFRPLLASSWEVSKDGLSYTFNLRKDVKWHDGVAFTADDVVFSYNSIKNPKVAAAHLRVYYQDVKSYTKIDSHTVRCEYAKPYFLALEYCGGIPIVAKHLFEKGDFNSNPAGRNPVGTGPYVFEKWETGTEIKVKKNPSYWGNPVYLDEIVYKVIVDSTVVFQLLKKEEIDLASLLPIQWAKQSCGATFRNKFYKTAYTTPNYYYIGWNSKKKFFEDKRVRTAMTHFVDRETILKEILLGLGEVVNSTFYINSAEYPKDIKPLAYDPRKAGELLDQAGWSDSDGDGIRDKDGVAFRFEFFLSTGSETGEKIATILKEELSRSGIEMTIRKMEWAVMLQNINERNFDAVSLGWSLGVDVDPYQIFHSSQSGSGSNFVGFENTEADALIEEAREEFSREKRVKIYRKFSQILHEEQPYTFLYARKSNVAVNKRFKNVKLYPLGIDPLEWYVPKGLRKY